MTTFERKSPRIQQDESLPGVSETRPNKSCNDHVARTQVSRPHESDSQMKTCQWETPSASVPPSDRKSFTCELPPIGRFSAGVGNWLFPNYAFHVKISERCPFRLDRLLSLKQFGQTLRALSAQSVAMGNISTADRRGTVLKFGAVLRLTWDDMDSLMHQK